MSIVVFNFQIFVSGDFFKIYQMFLTFISSMFKTVFGIVGENFKLRKSSKIMME